MGSCDGDGDGEREDERGQEGGAAVLHGPQSTSAYGAGMAERLVVKVTVGADAPERCAQAFTVASVALASGAQVSMWLTGEASWFAVPGRAEEFALPHSAPLAELRDAILATGTMTLCTQCAARRALTEADLLPGIRLAGAAVFVDEVMTPGTQALVY
jgi:predicted peroxiredoxin